MKAIHCLLHSETNIQKEHGSKAGCNNLGAKRPVAGGVLTPTGAAETIKHGGPDRLPAPRGPNPEANLFALASNTLPGTKPNRALLSL